ncbi:MAG: FtsK/SpoIIIE domain-containing protein, partial [Dehalococcoidia bacterium]
DGPGHTYLAVFGMDAAAGVLAQPSPDNPLETGRTSLRAVFQGGPARGVHVLGWWRGIQRFSDDVGGAGMREDVACLVALNVSDSALGSHLAQHTLQWNPRPNRALMIDLHEGRSSLIVPFVRPGRQHDGGGLR